MNIYSVVPYLLSMGVLLVIANSPLLKAADSVLNPARVRLTGFDGLRGFLALAVVFHHGVTYHLYIATGEWLIPPWATFYLLLGKFGVAGFFMITGYLFWYRILESRGKPNWKQLFIGRIFRLAPLYLAAATVMLFTVFYVSGLHWNEPPSKLVRQFIRWLSVGALRGYEFNGSSDAQLLLGVAWTMQFEWFFYFSLPLLSVFAGWHRASVILCLTALIVSVAYVWANTSASLFYSGLTYAEPIALFSFGITCATLANRGLLLHLPDYVSSLMAGTLIILAFAADPFIHSAGEILLLGAAFYLVTSGCSIFGLLTCRPARRLGDVSYSIYLLQNFVFSAVLAIAPVRTIALRGPFGHWSVIFGSAVLLVGLATVTYVWIERPGIELGKRVGMKGHKDRAPPADASALPASQAAQGPL